MKPTYNKSQIMKRAWNEYKGKGPFAGNFSECLRRSWEIEKHLILQAEAQKKEQPAKIMNTDTATAAWAAGCLNYYSNAHPGQYFGD